MSAVRFLPFFNAAGCLVLLGVVLFQWRAGQEVSRRLHESRSVEIVERNARAEAEELGKRLQADVDGLKASIDSMRHAAELSGRDLAAKDVELKTMVAAMEQARERIAAWEAAVRDRDEAIAARDLRLKELDVLLSATRKRLDEAVAELGKAGAR